jgi:hypothetical protein
MNRFMIALMVATVVAPAQNSADSTVLSALRRADPALVDVAILRRTPIGSGLDLVIALGGPKEWSPVEKGPTFVWPEKRKLGLFLQEIAEPEHVSTITIAPGSDDCGARIERATGTGTLISCMGEKSEQHPNQRFNYDIHTHRLTGRVSYQPFAMVRAFQNGAGAVFVGSDTQHLIAIAFDPVGTPQFHIMKGAEAQPWLSRVPTSEGWVGFDRQRILYIEPEAFDPPRFGPGGAFTLTQEKGKEVTERRGPAAVSYPMAQSAYPVFAAARPGRVKDGYVQKGTEIDERIGPWKLDGTRLWFGKAFYDGEGTTGVGGFGYFDSEDRKYHLFAPAEIADYSVSGIAIDPEAVWMPLVRNGEYGGTSGGLLRFDRQTHMVQKLEMPDIGTGCVEAGGRLLVATSFGVAVIEGRTVKRYFVDRKMDGALVIAAAEP